MIGINKNMLLHMGREGERKKPKEPLDFRYTKLANARIRRVEA